MEQKYSCSEVSDQLVGWSRSFLVPTGGVFKIDDNSLS